MPSTPVVLTSSPADSVAANLDAQFLEPISSDAGLTHPQNVVEEAVLNQPSLLEWFQHFVSGHTVSLKSQRISVDGFHMGLFLTV